MHTCIYNFFQQGKNIKFFCICPLIFSYYSAFFMEVGLNELICIFEIRTKFMVKLSDAANFCPPCPPFHRLKDDRSTCRNYQIHNFELASVFSVHLYCFFCVRSIRFNPLNYTAINFDSSDLWKLPTSTELLASKLSKVVHFQILYLSLIFFYV